MCCRSRRPTPAPRDVMLGVRPERPAHRPERPAGAHRAHRGPRRQRHRQPHRRRPAAEAQGRPAECRQERRRRLPRLRAASGPPVRPERRRAPLSSRLHRSTRNGPDMTDNQAEHRAHPQRRHGLLRPRLLRRRDRHAQPRPAGARRPALLAVLQHRALQPVARLDADRAASAPDRRRHPDLRLGPRGLRRQPQQALRDHSRRRSRPAATAPT